MTINLPFLLSSRPGMWRSIQLARTNLMRLARWRAAPSLQSLDRQRVFEWIHRTNAWGDPESASGTGSNVARASLFRDDFEALIRELRVRTLLDAPCGDFNWLRHFTLPIDRYVGVDIVPALIATNRETAPSRRHRFMVRDIVCDALPRADLILCRDALIHLSNADVLTTLKNFQRSGSTWLLTNTWPAHPDNPDIETGHWRTVDLQRPPFNLPQPVRVIDERCFGGDGAYRDKSLALWKLADLPL